MRASHKYFKPLKWKKAMFVASELLKVRVDIAQNVLGLIQKD